MSDQRPAPPPIPPSRFAPTGRTWEEQEKWDRQNEMWCWITCSVAFVLMMVPLVAAMVWS